MSLTLTLERGGGEVSGSGTQIELEGTGEGYSLESVTMNGDTEQTTIPGDQLLTKEGMATPLTDTSFWSSIGNLTSEDLGNGWARFKSTSSSGTHNFFTKYAAFQWEVSTTYTVIVELKNVPSSGNGSMTLTQPQNATDPFATTSAGGEVRVSFAGEDETVVFTGETKSSVTTNGLRCYFASGFTTNNTVDVRATIVKGDHLNDWQNYAGDNWQPFVGGVASPNPDYPQEVQNVTGRQAVYVTGKNLAKPYQTSGSITANGVTLTMNTNGSITLDGTATGSSWLEFVGDFTSSPTQLYTPTIPLDKNETYTLSYSIASGSVSGGTPSIWLQYDTPEDSSTRETSISITASGNSKSFTGKTGVYRMWVRSSSGHKYDNLVLQPQVERGPVATNFEPYQGQSYEINLGKNLFDKDNANVLNAYIDGTTTEIVSNASHRTIYIKCEPNTAYSLQKISTNRARNVASFESIPTIGDIGTKLSPLPATTTGSISSVSVVTPSNAHYLAINIYFSSQDSAYTFEEVLATTQIEKGPVATTYAPYFTPIELCKIGTYQDYIYKSGDDWYIHKETGKYTIIDTDVTQGADNTNVYFAAFPKQADDLASGSWPNTQTMVLSVATFRAYSQSWNRDIYIGKFVASASSSKYWVGFPAGTSLATATSKITGGELYYALATPTDTQITNADLIAQLDALSSAQTFDGETIITVNSENLKGSLDVTSEAPIYKTYTEVEIGSPFTIADVEGKSSNTTLDGNVYVDWAYNKKQYSFDLFNLTPQDYADIRAYYDYQFSDSAFPTVTVPELDINKLPVYMEISSRNIINQCLLTDKLTIKFRETVQP